MLLRTIGASLLGNKLAGKRINRAGEGVIEIKELVMDIKDKITKTKWIFNAPSSFN